MTGARIIVPVSESSTLRKTVAHAVGRLRERAEEGDGPAAIHFVYPLAERLGLGGETAESEGARTLLQRVAVWADEDLGEFADVVAVETAVIGTREYLFSPGDYADVIVRYARDHDVDVAVFDPGYNPVGTTPLLPPLEAEVEMAGLEVEEAPVTRERRRPQLVRRGTVAQFLTLFGATFLFYLFLAGSVAPFEVFTGAISATIVAVSLWGVSLTSPIRPGRTTGQLLRLLVYVPYLLWEVAKANVRIAYVALHPALPIDPEVVEFDAAVWSALPVATLANSITLTPGTLTVDVSRRHFTVHTLTRSSRADLMEGSLERAVRFVFYGRAAAGIPSPRERATEEGDDA